MNTANKKLRNIHRVEFHVNLFFNFIPSHSLPILKDYISAGTPALELHNSQSIDRYNTPSISYNLIISSHPKNNNSRLPSSSGIYQSIALPFSITC